MKLTPDMLRLLSAAAYANDVQHTAVTHTRNATAERLHLLGLFELRHEYPNGARTYVITSAGRTARIEAQRAYDMAEEAAGLRAEAMELADRAGTGGKGLAANVMARARYLAEQARRGGQ